MISRITIEIVLEKVKTYIKRESDLEMLKSAYNYAFLHHNGQYRKSGEPYIIHPLEVCYILADLEVGPNTLAAALLHDVVEDTETSLYDVSANFNPDIASMVDGVTKINKLKFDSNEKFLAENHQKMLLAMAKDIRVILIKLADRLHNMRTLDSMKREAQIRIANETLEIYAPLAHKLGMFRIKAELEDRSLRYQNPMEYYNITRLIKNKKIEREHFIEDMISGIEEHFKAINLTNYQIKGRIKNIYSIYKKMVNNNKDFSEIYDLLAIRIIVDKVETCYQALGIIHAHYVPIPKRFKDYIAVPKPNLYQSLHTTVVGVKGEIFEVQIRTKEMDEVAEVGIAAHWAYKENREYSREKEQFEIASKLKWYGELLKYSSERENKTASEFVDQIKGDILDANVYVFTPKGEVVALPKGATPLDFAYKIHTDVGNKTTGAIVNNRIVPLEYELNTGDIVNIKTSKQAFGPSEDWLKLVKTNHAKNKIKGFLNKQNRDILISDGKNDLDRELVAQKITETLTDDFVKQHFSKNQIYNVEDLYVEIGKKIISAKTVANKLAGVEISTDESLKKQMEKNTRLLTTNSETGIVVEGLPNPQIRLGNCCNPIPGDEVMGYVSKGNGIIVHTKDCNNMADLGNERFLDVYWASNITRKYPCRIKITASNKNNVFGDIINTINASSLSIISVNANQTNDFALIVKLKLFTANTIELDKLIVNLKKISDVYQIERDNK